MYKRQVEVQIPKYVLETLALGPKNPVLEKYNVKTTLAEVDGLLEFCESKECSPDMKNEIEAATIRYNKKSEQQIPQRNVIMKRKFVKDNDLFAVPMDKVNGFGAISKQKYSEKIKEVLKCEQFAKINKMRKNSKDPIFKEEERFNAELKCLLRESFITEEFYGDVRSSGGNAPRLYGLLKTHKSGTAVRPVLSMPGLPYYKLATKITEWLSVLSESRINSSTKHVVEDIKGLVLEEDEILISYDVQSLYTHVPADEAIQDAAELLYDGSHEEPPVDKATFIRLCSLCTKNVLMSTCDGYYIQKGGLVMGSPAPPPLSNICMSKFDKKFIQRKPKIYRRYVDDICLNYLTRLYILIVLRAFK